MVTTRLTLTGKYGVTEIAGASPTCTVTYTFDVGANSGGTITYNSSASGAWTCTVSGVADGVKCRT